VSDLQEKENQQRQPGKNPRRRKNRIKRRPKQEIQDEGNAFFEKLRKKKSSSRAEPTHKKKKIQHLQEKKRETSRGEGKKKEDVKDKSMAASTGARAGIRDGSR